MTTKRLAEAPPEAALRGFISRPGRIGPPAPAPIDAPSLLDSLHRRYCTPRPEAHDNIVVSRQRPLPPAQPSVQWRSHNQIADRPQVQSMPIVARTTSLKSHLRPPINSDLEQRNAAALNRSASAASSYSARFGGAARNVPACHGVPTHYSGTLKEKAQSAESAWRSAQLVDCERAAGAGSNVDRRRTSQPDATARGEPHDYDCVTLDRAQKSDFARRFYHLVGRNLETLDRMSTPTQDQEQERLQLAAKGWRGSAVEHSLTMPHSSKRGHVFQSVAKQFKRAKNALSRSSLDWKDAAKTASASASASASVSRLDRATNGNDAMESGEFDVVQYPVPGDVKPLVNCCSTPSRQSAPAPASAGRSEYIYSSPRRGNDSSKSTPSKSLLTPVRRSTVDSETSSSMKSRKAVSSDSLSPSTSRSRGANEKLKEQLDNVLQNLINEIDTLQATDGNQRTAGGSGKSAEVCSKVSLAHGGSIHASEAKGQVQVDEAVALPQAADRNKLCGSPAQIASATRKISIEKSAGETPRNLATPFYRRPDDPLARAPSPSLSVVRLRTSAPETNAPNRQDLRDHVSNVSHSHSHTHHRNVALVLPQPKTAPGNSDSRNADSASAPAPAVPLSHLRVDEIAALKRVAYANLTSLLETHCPSFKLQSSTWLFFRLMKRFRPTSQADDLPLGDNKVSSILSSFRKAKDNTNEASSKRVFGMPLEFLQTSSRSPLPPCIIEIMRFLQTTEQENLGIFRKAGNRKNIAELRRLIESVELSELQQLLSDYVEVKFTPFDAADCLKQFFRELPECILTNKLSDALITLYEHAPNAQRLEALHSVIHLLPDANREALKLLLAFLHNLAQSAKIHQMTASNFAVCFAPSLFYFPNAFTPVHSGAPPNSRTRRATGIPDMNELLKQKAAQQCLTDLINHGNHLFTVTEADLSNSRNVRESRSRAKDSLHSGGSPEFSAKNYTAANASTISDMSDFEDEFYSEARSACGPASTVSESWPVKWSPETPLRYRTLTDTVHYALLVDSFLNTIMKEYRSQRSRRRRGWIAMPVPRAYLVCEPSLSCLSYKRMVDGHALNMWRCSIEIAASPNAVFRRLILEESTWNSPTLISSEVFEYVDVNVDIVYRLERDSFVLKPVDMTPTITDRCVLRCWRHDLANSKNVKAIVCTSIDHPRAPPCNSEIARAHVYEHAYVIEPVTQRKTRVTLFSREDIRGKSSDWYQRFWPFHCCSQLARLKASFERSEVDADGNAEVEERQKARSARPSAVTNPISELRPRSEPQAASPSPDPDRETVL